MKSLGLVMICLALLACKVEERPVTSDAGLDLDAPGGRDVTADRPAPDRPAPDSKVGRDLTYPDGCTSLDQLASGCGFKIINTGECGKKCPKACQCEELLTDPFPLKNWPHVCATPCFGAWDCKLDERCGYLQHYKNPSNVSICMPPAVKTDPKYGSGSIDCVFDPRIGRKYCLGNKVMQYQMVGLTGGYSGCVMLKTIIEDCSTKCVAIDGGVAACADGGPPKVKYCPVSCCPVSPGAYFCFNLGGAKVPPRGCEIACCQYTACKKWKKVTDSYGCPKWVKK